MIWMSSYILQSYVNVTACPCIKIHAGFANRLFRVPWQYVTSRSADHTMVFLTVSFDVNNFTWHLLIDVSFEMIETSWIFQVVEVYE